MLITYSLNSTPQVKHIKMIHSPKVDRELMSPPLPVPEKRSSPPVIVNGNKSVEKFKEIPIKVTIPAVSGLSSGSR